VSIRSRRGDSGSPPAVLSEWFGADRNVTEDRNFGMFIGEIDIENVRKLVSDLHEHITSLVEARERQFLAEMDRGQKFPFKFFS
jgi:hypothetical protein